ncbi:MAG: tRNA (adenosine(37)-N6)-threonylcarbamoyltransferase complex transferase subunit TsaD [Candidatus Falkowbacteria bacterium]|nr:tRNA (adenosine(37)-N6)-threonylcarbamoyltransferase complex transferase subunit TsaD [Candidatus Falkowbacteria bacterium]
MYILGIETSCDETAASIIQVNSSGKLTVLTNIISSQIEIHKKYGGVIPEVAAREHVLNILPVINESLAKAKIDYKKIDLIAVTKGPGLITSLITGLETAKTLAYAWKKPLIGINHIEGHIYSNFINPSKPIKFPALVLTVSGGHTILVLMLGHNKYKIIGETLDDAAGEAYDKGAKMLGLGYPGGPIISKLAIEYKNSGQSSTLKLPRPMLNVNNFNFSFSGLKTSLLYKLKKDNNWPNRINEYCFAYEEAIIEILVKKTLKAATKYKIKTIMLAGGVSANKELREEFKLKLSKKYHFLVPALDHTTDNAVMIATAGYYRYKNKGVKNRSNLKVDSNLKLQ